MLYLCIFIPLKRWGNPTPTHTFSSGWSQYNFILCYFSAPLTHAKCCRRTWWWSVARPCCQASYTGCWPRFACWWRNPSTAMCWPARTSACTCRPPSPTAPPGSEVWNTFLTHSLKKKKPRKSDFKLDKFPLGAIFGALQDILGSRSVSRDYYNQTGRIPDWCCLSTPLPESLYEAGKTPPPLMKRAFSTEK